ncbi:hypothetical protein BJX64DRAFT_200404 [Aspergillus heterothallicus]
MIPFLTRLRTVLGDRPFSKVGIVCEGDDFANDKALLQHLSDNPIENYTPDRNSGASAQIGRNRQHRFDFTLVFLGTNGPKCWLIANALLYSDSDALIVIVDALNPWSIDSLRCSLEMSVKGTVDWRPRDFYPTVRKGIPWLVLVNFKVEPVDQQKARELVDSLSLDALDVEWHVCAVSTTSGSGIYDAAWLLRRKLDTPGARWRDLTHA